MNDNVYNKTEGATSIMQEPIKNKNSTKPPTSHQPNGTKCFHISDSLNLRLRFNATFGTFGQRYGIQPLAGQPEESRCISNIARNPSNRMEFIRTEPGAQKCPSIGRASVGRRDDLFVGESRLEQDGEPRTHEELSTNALLSTVSLRHSGHPVGPLRCETGSGAQGCGRQSAQDYHFDVDPKDTRTPPSTQRDVLLGAHSSTLESRTVHFIVPVEKTSIYDGKSTNYMPSNPRRRGNPLHEFFHASTGSQGIKIAGMLRLAYGILVTISLLISSLDYSFLFLPSTGVLPLEIGRKTLNVFFPSILCALPNADKSWWIVLVLASAQSILLAIGAKYTRFHAVGVFFWLTSIQNTNGILWNGEDTVMRILGFLFIFFPLHGFTLSEWLDTRRNQLEGIRSGTDDVSCNAHGDDSVQHPTEEESFPMWPIRLMQIEMCLIYFSTAVLKASGNDWRDGTVMYYVTHLDDLYGGLYNPDILFGYYGPLRLMTYSALVVETAGPILLWFKATRIPALVTIVLFHVGMALAMNLNCFQYTMIIGWLSFLIQPEDEERQESKEEYQQQEATSSTRYSEGGPRDEELKQMNKTNHDLHTMTTITQQLSISLEAADARALAQSILDALDGN